MSATLVQQPNPATQSEVVVVVNDQPIMGAALAQLAAQVISRTGNALKVAARVTTRAQAKECLVRFRPRLLVTEIRLANELCFDFLETVHAKHRTSKTLVVSQLPEAIFAERVLQSGASGFVSTTASTTEIQSAISKVIAGDLYVSPEVERQILLRLNKNGQDAGQSINRCSTSTNRELMVLNFLGKGHPPREIADLLDLSVKTIETYRDRLKKKLGLNSTFQLLRFALECHILGFGQVNP